MLDSREQVNDEKGKQLASWGSPNMAVEWRWQHWQVLESKQSVKHTQVLFFQLVLIA